MSSSVLDRDALSVADRSQVASLPISLALGMAASSRRQVPAGTGAGLLVLAACVASVVFAAADEGGMYAAASVRWLPAVLLPAFLGVTARLLPVRAGGRAPTCRPSPRRSRARR